MRKFTAVIKKNKKKCVVVGTIVIALVAFFSIVAGYHFVNSSDAEDMDALAKQASDYLDIERLEIRNTTQKGNYLAALCVDEAGVSHLCVYERDEIFDKRWYASGGITGIEKGKVVNWNYGNSDKEAVIVFCGADLSDEVCWYSFNRKEISYTCPVKDNFVLDVFVFEDASDINGVPVLLDEEKQEID